jgi:hypothetical protein
MNAFFEEARKPGAMARHALAWRAWKSREIRTFPGCAEQSSRR